MNMANPKYIKFKEADEETKCRLYKRALVNIKGYEEYSTQLKADLLVLKRQLNNISDSICSVSKVSFNRNKGMTKYRYYPNGKYRD
jgi:hypothetical protein